MRPGPTTTPCSSIPATGGAHAIPPESLASLLQNAGIAVVRITPDGRFADWNAGAERLFGYAASEMLGQPVAAVLHEPASTQPPLFLAASGRGERLSSESVVGRKKDGREFDGVAVPVVLTNDAGAYSGLAVLIKDTSLLLHIKQLRRARELAAGLLARAVTIEPILPPLLRALGDTLHCAAGEYWRLDREAGVLRFGATWCARSQDPALEAFSRAARDMILPPGSGLPGRAWAERRAMWVTDVTEDLRFLRSSQARRAGLRSAFAFPVIGGDAVMGVMVFFLHDARERDEDLLETTATIGAEMGLVFERNRAVEARASGEAQMNAVVASAADAILTFDERGSLRSSNPATERLFGHPLESLPDLAVSQLLPPPYGPEGHRDLLQFLREAPVLGKPLDLVGRRANGSTFPCQAVLTELSVGETRYYTGILRDMTAFKAIQDELVRTRSLALIGEAAASLAHEIKNPLAAIAGPLQIFRDDMSPNDGHRIVMDEILHQIRRLDGTVRQLLMLSRPWNPKKEPTDVVAVARKVALLLQEHPAFSSIRFRCDPDPLPSLPADPGYLEQVLWNLALNAAEALQEGPLEGEVRFSFKECHDVVEILVVDTGPGMSPDLQARLFKPFFTTKKEGNGLGLAICRKIMEAHGGTIEIASRPGSGTCVTVRLPRA